MIIGDSSVRDVSNVRVAVKSSRAQRRLLVGLIEQSVAVGVTSGTPLTTRSLAWTPRMIRCLSSEEN
jgi:hypothetical protein